jgi:chromosome segregation ATPase
VLLHDLPQAEQTARALADQIRTVGSESSEKTTLFSQRVSELADQTRTADQLVAEATDRLAARLAEIESAAIAAAARVGEAEHAYSGTLDVLLDRTSATLDQVRAGIDVQSTAVAALLAQATAGIGKAGADAAESLAANIDHANSSIEGLSVRVAEQDRASQRMIAEIDRGLALIDQRFSEIAANGDERANRFLESLTRARAELDTLAAEASTQDGAIGSLAERTTSLRESISRLSNEIREGVGVAIGEAQGSADRLAAVAEKTKPEIGWLRDATVEASDRLAGSQRCWEASTAALRARSRSSPSSLRCWRRSSGKPPISARKPGRRWSHHWYRLGSPLGMRLNVPGKPSPPPSPKLPASYPIRPPPRLKG